MAAKFRIFADSSDRVLDVRRSWNTVLELGCDQGWGWMKNTKKRPKCRKLTLLTTLIKYTSLVNHMGILSTKSLPYLILAEYKYNVVLYLQSYSPFNRTLFAWSELKSNLTSDSNRNWFHRYNFRFFFDTWKLYNLGFFYI